MAASGAVFYFWCVSEVIFKYFVLYIDVAKGYDVSYVAMAKHVCSKCMFRMINLF
jgi:hypothetical protein